MVIASVAGGELWDRARKAYMTAHPRPFMRLLHSVLSGDWAGAGGGSCSAVLLPLLLPPLCSLLCLEGQQQQQC